MKMKYISLSIAVIAILYWFYLYFMHPDGYYYYFDNPYLSKEPYLMPLIGTLEVILYPILNVVFGVLSYTQFSKKWEENREKPLRSFYFMFSLIHIASIIFLYIIVEQYAWAHVHQIKVNQLTTFTLVLLCFFSANYYNDKKNLKPSIFSNEYMESNKSIWIRANRLRAIILIVIGLVLFVRIIFNSKLLFTLAIVLFLVSLFYPKYYAKKLYTKLNCTNDKLKKESYEN